MGSNSEIVKKPCLTYESTRRQPDMERAKEYLKALELTVQLDERLQRTIAYFDSLLSEQ